MCKCIQILDLLFRAVIKSVSHQGSVLVRDEPIFVPYLLAKEECLLSCGTVQQLHSSSSFNTGIGRLLLANMKQNTLHRSALLRRVQ